MTTDNEDLVIVNGPDEHGEYHGTCYNLDDARRALRDRPSMEAELQCLREECERLRGELEAEEGAHAMCARAAKHFEGALRRIAEQAVHPPLMTHTAAYGGYDIMARMLIDIARAALSAPAPQTGGE